MTKQASEEELQLRCERLARNLELSEERLRWWMSSHAILLGMFFLVLALLIWLEVTR